MLWFGTKDGLNRYDGCDILCFRHDPSNTGSLSNSNIIALTGDRRGRLWVATGGGGLDLYEPDSLQFRHFPLVPDEPDRLPSAAALCLLTGEDGLIWTGTSHGLLLFDPAAGRCLPLPPELAGWPGLAGGNITCLWQDRHRFIWAVDSLKGVFRFDRQGKKPVFYPNGEKDPDRTITGVISGLTEDSHGNVWITGSGLNRLDPATGRVTHFFSRQPAVPDSLIYDDLSSIAVGGDSLWIGTVSRGLDRMDLKTGRCSHFRPDPDHPHLSNFHVISRLLLDDQHILWIGTNGGGLYKLNLRPKPFFRISHETRNPDSLSFSSVRSLFHDQNGDLYIGGYSGLDRYRPSTGRCERLSGEVVYSMMPDPENPRLLWLGMEGNGLWRLHTGTGRMTRFSPAGVSPVELAGTHIYCLLKTRAGEIWAGTETGLNRIDGWQGRVQSFRPSPEDPRALFRGYIRAIREDSRGQLWIGSLEGGLHRLDRGSGQFQRCRHDPADPHSISSNRVICIHEDARRRLWIGTTSGLNRLDAATGRFIRYNRQDGLPSDVINAILEDRSGCLWLSTNQGISRFDPATGGFRNYDQADGLMDNELNGSAACRGPDGELFFGGLNGVVHFRPEEIRDNIHQPAVAITGFQILNLPAALPDFSTAGTRLLLTPRQNVFSFQFAALDYVNPRRNQYAYRLEGFDPDWINTGSDRRYALYTNLDPGEYTFRVKASNNDGVWNETGLAIPLTVLPPWWKTWWFRGGIIMMIVLVTVSLFRWRVREMENRRRELEDEVRQRTADLNTVLDERGRLIRDLQNALASIKHLKGLLPICANCKKIRDDRGYWHQVESFIHEHSDASFSHGICPDCFIQLYGELESSAENQEERPFLAGADKDSG